MSIANEPKIVILQKSTGTVTPGVIEVMKPTEEHEQEALFNYASWQKEPEWNLLFSIPNGGYRKLKTGIRMKKTGLKPGVPDLQLPVARGMYHGLLFVWGEKTSKNRKDLSISKRYVNYIMSLFEIIIGTLIGVVITYIINTSKTLHNFIRRNSALLLNKQTCWSITARFEKEDGTGFDYSVFESIKKYFIREYSKTLNSIDNCTIDKDIPNTFVYNCGGLTFQVNYSSGSIFLQLREYHAPYRDSLKILAKKIIPLLTELKKDIEMNTVNSKLRIGYSSKIKFEGENPFIGQYLTKQNDLDLRTFSCILEGMVGTSNVEIQKDKLEFQSNDLAILHSLMNEHLSMSG